MHPRRLGDLDHRPAYVLTPHESNVLVELVTILHPSLVLFPSVEGRGLALVNRNHFHPDDAPSPPVFSTAS